MGRAPCCDKANVKKGPWSPEEDTKLKAYIEQHGTGGNWIALPQKIGLKRCGKSCRLRWLNYLRPNIKHGGFSEEEDNIICSLYVSIGSRWSIIAAQLPGRTDNDIKNYWNTRLKKKLAGGRGKQQQQQQAGQDMINTQSSHTTPQNTQQLLPMQIQSITPTPTWPSTTSIQHYCHLNLNTTTQPSLSNHHYHQQPYSNAHDPYHHHSDDMISFQLPHPQPHQFIPTSIINTNLRNHPAPAAPVSATTDNTNTNSSSSSCHESPNMFEGGFEGIPNDLSELVQFVDVKPQQQVLDDAILDMEVQGYQGMASTESTSWGDITSHHHLYSSPFISQTQPMPQIDFAFGDSYTYFGMQ